MKLLALQAATRAPPAANPLGTKFGEAYSGVKKVSKEAIENAFSLGGIYSPTFPLNP